MCLLPRWHRLANQVEVSPHDLTRETLISFEPAMTHGRLIESTYKRAGAYRLVNIFVRSVDSAISFVVEGLEVAIVVPIRPPSNGPQMPHLFQACPTDRQRRAWLRAPQSLPL